MRVIPVRSIFFCFLFALALTAASWISLSQPKITTTVSAQTCPSGQQLCPGFKRCDNTICRDTIGSHCAVRCLSDQCLTDAECTVSITRPPSPTSPIVTSVTPIVATCPPRMQRCRGFYQCVNRTCVNINASYCATTCTGNQCTPNLPCGTPTITSAPPLQRCPNLVSGSIQQQSVDPRGTLNITCDYGKVLDCIAPASNPPYYPSCNWAWGGGTKVNFTCTAPSTPGQYQNLCTLFQGQGSIDNCCLRQDVAGSFTVNCPAQLAPTQISPSGLTLPGTTRITWNTVQGATAYHLRINDHYDNWQPAGGATGTCADVTNPDDRCVDNLTTNSFADFVFKAGHQYSIWVHASNTCGSWSPPHGTDVYVDDGGQFPTVPTISAPASADPQNPTVVLGTTIIVGWQQSLQANNVPVSKYAVRLDRLEGGRLDNWAGDCAQPQYPGDVCTDVTTRTHQFSIAPGETYKVWVSGVDSVTNRLSEPSVRYFTVSLPAPFCWNSGIRATSITDTQVNLSWNAYPAARKYVLRYAQKDAAGLFPNWADVPGAGQNDNYTSTTFTHTGLTPGVTYGYLVMVVAPDKSGEVPRCPVVEATTVPISTLTPTPTAPACINSGGAATGAVCASNSECCSNICANGRCSLNCTNTAQCPNTWTCEPLMGNICWPPFGAPTFTPTPTPTIGGAAKNLGLYLRGEPAAGVNPQVNVYHQDTLLNSTPLDITPGYSIYEFNVPNLQPTDAIDIEYLNDNAALRGQPDRNLYVDFIFLGDRATGRIDAEDPQRVRYIVPNSGSVSGDTFPVIPYHHPAFVEMAVFWNGRLEFNQGASPTNSHVGGVIYDRSTGLRVADATVELWYANESAHRVTSAADGFYIFYNVIGSPPAGKGTPYQIRVTKTGYQPGIQPITVQGFNYIDDLDIYIASALPDQVGGLRIWVERQPALNPANRVELPKGSQIVLDDPEVYACWSIPANAGWTYRHVKVLGPDHVTPISNALLALGNIDQTVGEQTCAQFRPSRPLGYHYYQLEVRDYPPGASSVSTIKQLVETNMEIVLNLGPNCQALHDKIQAAFSNSCGDPNYDKIGDINKDSRVDIFDNNLLVTNALDEPWCSARLADPTDPCVVTPTPTSGASLVCPAACGVATGNPGYTGPGRDKGDADCNGVVDLNDFAIWLAGYQLGMSGDYEPNFICDATLPQTLTVDREDFNRWRSNYQP